MIREPVDEWSDRFRASLGRWNDDIPRPNQEPISLMRDRVAHALGVPTANPEVRPAASRQK